jgi:hypothetical protein
MSTVKEIGGLLFAIAFFGGMTVGSIAAVVAGIWLVATAPWILFGIPVALLVIGFWHAAAPGGDRVRLDSDTYSINY